MAFNLLLEAVKALPEDVGFVSMYFWLDNLDDFKDPSYKGMPPGPNCGCLLGQLIHAEIPDYMVSPGTSVKDLSLARVVMAKYKMTLEEVTEVEYMNDAYYRRVNSAQMMKARRAYMTKWLEERCSNG